METKTEPMSRERKALLQQDQIAELRAEQRAEFLGDKSPDLVTANRNSKFKIKAREAQGYVHIWTRIKNLANDQKSFIFEDKVVCIRLREFERMVEQRAFAQFDEYDVIHHPTDTKTIFKLKDDPDQPSGKATKAALENVAVRERQLADKESQIDEKLAALDARIEAADRIGQDLVAQQQEVARKSLELDELIKKAQTVPAAGGNPTITVVPGPTATAAEMPNPSPIPPNDERPKEEPKAEGAKPETKADKKAPK